ncbi:MAG: insulinase family protein [Phycisphaeraceae bacterium]|nr:insulinase family protein [Phycisphaeraceae bacterium]
MPEIHTHTFSNGLTLVAEPMVGVRSLAMTLLTPAGVARQPEPQQGVAPLLAELLTRGAGGSSSRDFNEALDTLGVHRSAGAGNRHLRLGATLVGEHLDAALPLLLSQALAPNLDANELEPSRDLCLQEIAALDDDPQRRAMIALREHHFPEPLGRPSDGVAEHLKALSIEDVRSFWQAGVVPGGSILSFAGQFDWDKLCDTVAALTADWSGQADEVQATKDAPRGYTHLEAQTEQAHIGLAYDAPADPDEQSMLQRAAVSVLSGGMSSRLFTEVREKRGLCYSVYASYAGMRDRGAVLGYAGTTTPRAQETLDVFVGELRRMSQGVEADELQRAMVGMKARLVMQGESSGARAGAIAADLYVHGRPRTLAELADRVDSVTLDDVNRYVAERVVKDITAVTIGPERLNFPE